MFPLVLLGFGVVVLAHAVTDAERARLRKADQRHAWAMRVAMERQAAAAEEAERARRREGAARLDATAGASTDPRWRAAVGQLRREVAS